MQIELRVAGAPVRHGARQLLGQESQGFALAVWVLQCCQGLLAGGMIPQKKDGRCREGPLKRGVPALRARGAVRLPG